MEFEFNAFSCMATSSIYLSLVSSSLSYSHSFTRFLSSSSIQNIKWKTNWNREKTDNGNRKLSNKKRKEERRRSEKKPYESSLLHQNVKRMEEWWKTSWAMKLRKRARNEQKKNNVRSQHKRFLTSYSFDEFSFLNILTYSRSLYF